MERRPVEVKRLADYLDEFLDVVRINDSALNGLQIEGSREVYRVALAVDAALGSFRQAVEMGAQLLVVHHGLFWARREPVTGLLYNRIKYLVENDLALYASHLPLDLHAEVGNNVQLAKAIGLRGVEPFLEYNGQKIGFAGRLDPVPLRDLTMLLGAALGGPPQVIAFGKQMVETIGICSGGAGLDVTQAIAANLDCFITGETSHGAYALARDGKINVIFAGHYLTETLGLKALGRHISEKFGLETVFLDLPTGF